MVEIAYERGVIVGYIDEDGNEVFNEDNEERDYLGMDKERYQNNDMDNNKFYSYMIVEPINKSYKNIFYDDLDGWDEPIEEYS